MKNIIFLLFLTLIILTSCQGDKDNSEIEKKSYKNILPLSEEYNWKNYKIDNAFGEVLYIPVYSSIYHQGEETFDLATTLSIHNIDINSGITVTKIDYYNTNGELVKSFIEDGFVLNPLQSKQVIIKETDISGGTAAKFVIQWLSEKRVLKPVVEAVMISTSSQQGISFKTESRVISTVGY